ncbi:MAG: hypothetical protein RI897_3767 [Verrucomicrobiota bacterium]|jgi:hypothetical protein
MDGLEGCGGAIVVGGEPGQWWEGSDQSMEFLSELGGERQGGGRLGEEEDAGDLPESEEDGGGIGEVDMFDEVFDGEAFSGGQESLEREGGIVEVELEEREGLLEMGITDM